MFLKRIEIEKKFDSKDLALGFSQGIEFVGVREFKVKEIKEQDSKFIVVLEKLEKSKT